VGQRPVRNYRRRAFGAEVVPGCYEDFGEADLIVIVGSNSAGRHAAPFERTKLATAQRGALLRVIDPRRAAIAEFADLFPQIVVVVGSAPLYRGFVLREVACERFRF
jgi:anaerobic selenocysteine-containing dehydrogenase